MRTRTLSPRRSLRLSLVVSALVALTASGLTSVTLAAGLEHVDQTIFGMDCAPCAYGIEQGLRKLPGVTSVRVSLNEGKAAVTLEPNNATTLASIREVIRHNGFTPKDAQVLIAGQLEERGRELWLEAGAAGAWRVQNEAASSASLVATPDSAGEVALRVRVPETLATPPTVYVIERER